MKETITNAHAGLWVNILTGKNGHSQLNGRVVNVDPKDDSVTVVTNGPNGETLQKCRQIDVKLWKTRNHMLRLTPKAEPEPAPRQLAQRREPAPAPAPVHPPIEKIDVERRVDANDAREAAMAIPYADLFGALERAKADMKTAHEMLQEAAEMKREAELSLSAIKDRIRVMMED